MNLYQTRSRKLSGTSYSEIIKKARLVFHSIEKRSKRTAYLKSPYFNKEKIFLNLFWDHLNQKHQRERKCRLKFLPCAFELIENSRNKPVSKPNPNDKTEILHRFGGLTPDSTLFYVQIKENIKTGRKDFMSVFMSE